jgi:PAS domain S-box-containing protein
MIESVQSAHRIVSSTVPEHPIRVLHVDDDPAFLRVAKQCLEMQGEFEVDTVSSVNEALEKLEKTAYDAVVSDYQMPGKDGLKFLEELREKGNSVPFVVFTGKGREEIAVRALNLGADGYFDKMGQPETVYGELAHGIHLITEKKRAETGRLDEEEKLRAILASSPDAIMVNDLKGTVVDCNEAALRLGGYSSKEDVVGRNALEFVSEKDRIASLESLKKISELGTMRNVEYTALKKNGETYIAEISGSILKNSVGNPTGFVSVIRDITERKKAEHILQESEERFRAIFEGATDGILAADVKTKRFAFANPGICEITGYSLEELLKLGVSDIIPKKDLPYVLDNIAEQMQGIITLSKDIPVLRKDEKVVCCDVNSKSIRIGGQEYLVGFFRDVTVRKNAEDKLKESEEKYRSLVELAPDGIMAVSAEGIVISVNRSFLKLVGYDSEEEIVGKPFWELKTMRMEDIPRFQSMSKSLIKEGSSSPIEFPYFRKDGTSRWAEVHPGLLIKDGNPVGLQVIMRDVTEQKKAERDIRIENDALASSIGAVAFADLKGNLTYVNNSFLRIWGYANDKEVLGRPATEFWLSEEKASGIAKALNDGKGWIGELTAKKKDGSTFQAQLSASLVKDETGEPLCMMGSFIDVTERNKAEEELKNSEERLRVLFELAPDAYYLNDLKGNFIDGNRAAEELTGYIRGELVGKSFLKLKLLHRSQALKAAKLLAMNAFGKPTGPDEFVLNRKDGTQVPVEIRTYPVKIKGKTLVLGIARDITIRKKNEQAILESQQKFEGLFRHNPEAAVHLDLDFKVLDVNPRFCELFGYSAEEVEGKWINEVVAPEGMIEEAEMLDKDAKKGYASRDTIRKRKDGSLVHVSISATPVTIEGRLFGYVGVYKDITDLKNAQEHLKEINRRLEVTNEKLHVVGGLTRHDVRNKLSAVTGNAYLLRRRLAEDPKALEQLNDIEAAVRLVERIFEFARVYERLGVEQLANLDVGEAVAGAVSLFSDLKGVKIVNECGGLTVLADSMLRQLLYNLIDNSLKYGEKIRQIKIYYKTPSPDKLELVYEDDGSGIPDNMRSSLFKEGFTSGKGSGYGLFMIKRICEVYGWTIQEAGTPGKGAKFTMSIPRTGSTGKANYQIQKPQKHEEDP